METGTSLQDMEGFQPEKVPSGKYCYTESLYLVI